MRLTDTLANIKEKVLLVNEVLDTNISDSDKVEKILKIITLSEWELIYVIMDNPEYESDLNFRNVGIKYKYFYSKGLLKRYVQTYACDLDEMKFRLNLLKEINGIIFSDVRDEEKLYSMLKYYPKLIDFKRKYTLFIMKGESDIKLDYWRDVLNNFDNIIAKLEELFNKPLVVKNAMYRKVVTDMMEDNLYLENYLYAEWVINTFINYDRNYLKSEFISKLNITLEEFEYCVELIKFLNPILYKEYEEAVVLANKKRVYNLDKTYLNLANGIRHGCLLDGTDFDLLEFYKRIPFKNHGKAFMKGTIDFLNRIYGSDSPVTNTIISYLKQNKITSIRFISKDDILNRVSYVKGILITKEIVDDVFDYIDAYDLPKTYGVYSNVVKRYLDNEIDMNHVKNKLAENLRLQLAIRESFTNPFTLVKKMV